MSKDYNDVLHAALESGNWRLIRRGKKHKVIEHIPSGRRTGVGGSPSDYRAAANLAAQIRRLERNACG